MSDVKWTAHQADAISHGGHDILVSASAGSGKTAVLVERIIQQVLAGADITRMLIVTFTNAATDEMRDKIQRGLKKTLSARDEEVGERALTPSQRRNLVDAIAKSPTASISTLDAFAKQVVAEYYYLLSLDPQFRIETDETELALLNQRVFDTLKEEEFYPGSDTVDAADFISLTENFDSSLSDAGLAEVVFSLVDFAQSLPNPSEWLKNLSNDYSDFPAFMRRYWAELRLGLEENAASFRTLIKEALDDPELQKVVEVLQVSLDGLNRALELENPSYDEIKGALSSIEYPRWPSNGVSDDAKEHRKAMSPKRKALKDELEALQEPFVLPFETLETVLAQAARGMSTLSSVTLRFMVALEEEKQARQIQSFGDIMQHAMTILQTIDPATGQLVADNYRDAFDTILVDEYQDLNSLQEEMVRLIAIENPGNRFMVGDVKQSIYGFRLANPQLFLDKYERFSKEEDPGELIILGENFRSSKNVLNFTNLIFTQLMDKAVGKLDYDQNAELLLGPGIPDEVNPETELQLLVTDTADSDDASSVTDTASELARLMIKRINELVSDETPSFFDKAKGEFRRYNYSDITILVRGAADNVVLQSEFAKAGVPIVIPKAKNYFQTTELMTMLSVLRLIDNPTQDVALVAVLRSPIVELSSDELAQIRLLAPRGAFYRAVETLLEGTDEEHKTLREKVLRFTGDLERWRHDARTHELVDLIWDIYHDTGFFDFVGGQPGGDQRQANLRALSDRAAAFEQNGFRGLFSFVRFIEQMQKSDKDLATPVFVDPGLNAVKLMTVHASKGLQFPVVFLWASQKKFMLKELSDPLILGRENVGLKWTDAEKHERYMLPQWTLARDEKRKQLYAEEMRLLYVALTRAQQQLVLFGAVKSEEQALKRWMKAAETDTHVLAPGMRLKDGSYLDWIGHALARTGVLDGSPQRTDLMPFKTPIKINFTPPIEAPQPLTREEKTAREERLGIDFKRYWSTPYKQQAATTLSSFQSVSELKNSPLLNDPAVTEVLKANRGPLQQATVADFAEPSFKKPAQTSATAIGTATHLLLKTVELNGDIKENLEAARTTLIESGALEEAVAANINLEHIRTFFEGGLGQAIRENPTQVYRETPFSLLLPADEVYSTPTPLPDDYDVLVHGVIDGYLDQEDGIIVFDYKTDHKPTADKLKARYGTQLLTYARALSLMTEKKVKDALLVALETGELISVLAPSEGTE